MAFDPEIRRLTPKDASQLAAFYNELAPSSKRTFRPLGERTDVGTCLAIVQDNAAAAKYDIVAIHQGQIVAWAFLWDIAPESAPTFGLAVADAFQGQGLGSRLMSTVMKAAGELGIAQVSLTVVQDNCRAWQLYENHGFVRCGEFEGQDGLLYYRMSASLDGHMANQGDS